jgi:DNA-directed RNA polymerase specialized sigma subunit
MAKFEVDADYRLFADQLEGLLQRHEANIDPDEDLLIRQRRQLRNLIELEVEFRRVLLEHRWGPATYRKFMEYILDDKKNILAARPFFRERHETFTSKISKAFKTRSDKDLYSLNTNWTFVKWVLNLHKWPKNGKVAEIARAISCQRTELLEQNIPLALSQSRLFWNSVPRSHLSYMDIVQIHCMSFMLAIDKFVAPKGEMTEEENLKRFKSFRAVVIGIMMRDRVNAYSETMLHYWPGDRAKLYAANKIARRHQNSGGTDLEAVAEECNKILDPKNQTTSEELGALMAGGSPVTLNVLAKDKDGTQDNGDQPVWLPIAPEDQPDNQFEQQELVAKLVETANSLGLREQKLLRLKGIKL